MSTDDVGRSDPDKLSMEIDFWGYLSKQVADLEGISTLANELIQNADDAKDDRGNLSANQITFDITDKALVVMNDAVFREIDFERIKIIANGEKRLEEGVRTTGAFGIGFLSVYQITDRPELFSAGRHWIFEPQTKQILSSTDTSVQGTCFRLPWATTNSFVRTKLRKPPVDLTFLDSWVSELQDKLPISIIFLKKLNTIELRRNGKSIMQIQRTPKDGFLQVNP